MTEANAGRRTPAQKRGVVPTRWGLIWIAAAVGLATAYGIAWLMGPHPDTTLQREDGVARSPITSLLNHAPVEVDPATLEPYEVFRGLQPWTATDALGNPCLIVVEPATSGVHGGSCTPREADLIVDVGAWPAYHDRFAEGLPDGTVIRFQLRGDAIDVSVHRPAEPDAR
ncbi:hypothetical protein ACFC1I_02130 [Microbacterium sp. NPDC056044]|uniref:hypothetical protein n=1 Tax=Microbacterium sp. NPDC056044 TaxID=3345690 RepID=UPI0035D94390